MTVSSATAPPSPSGVAPSGVGTSAVGTSGVGTSGVGTSDPVATARSHAIADLLRRSAARVPDKLALVSGEIRWTYREFDLAVNRTAHALSARGLEKGQRLAILSHNCWQYAVLNYALARLGAVMVPINFMLGPDEVAGLLRDSGCTAIVSEDALAEVAMRACEIADVPPGIRGWLPLANRPAPAGWEDAGQWALSSDETYPDVLVADDDVLRLMYTSGTESTPKGVMLSSRSLINQYVSCVIDGGMSADDVEVHALPLYHCAQLDCFLGVDVYLGATSIVLPGPDPATVLASIEAERATKFFAPPTVWIALMRSPQFERTDLSSLRKGYYGASAMPVEVLREIQQRLPNLQLWNFYGQTELAPLATVLQPGDQLAHAGSAGRPAVNVETRIVDDDGTPVPPGTVGEIVHRSPQACLGYWNRPDKTAEAFAGGWFHSGDLGFVDADGLLSVVDRKKDMVKTGGENVASREVEEVLYLHPDVVEAAVFGVPHPTWVEAVTAAVVLRAGSSVGAAELIEHCRAHLAAYKCPKFVVSVDELPKNPSGKLLKRSLRTTFADLASR